MKRESVALAGRGGLVTVIFVGLLWMKGGTEWAVLYGGIGLLLSVGLSVKKRCLNTVWILGWGYWIFLGIIGPSIHKAIASSARIWGGDGSFLWLTFLLAFALLYAAACWNLCRSIEVSSLPLFRFIKTDKRPAPNGEWEPITFVLGEDKTEEEYRLGGE